MTEPDTFHDKIDPDAHIKFHQWRQRHWGNGYFLNYKGPSDTTLHRAKCTHYSNKYWDHGDKRPDWERGGKSMTATKKICSTSRPVLEDWARKEATKRGKDSKIKRCPDC